MNFFLNLLKNIKYLQGRLISQELQLHQFRRTLCGLSFRNSSSDRCSIRAAMAAGVTGAFIFMLHLCSYFRVVIGFFSHLFWHSLCLVGDLNMS
jgi:hypothetical protein